MVSVQRSLKEVPGVTHAEVDLRTSQAVVTFDDAKTDVEALTRATGAAGFPAKLKAEQKTGF